ncbi:ATP-dependent DNA helicase RecG [Methyloceanibacter methanicus]|uniref:ATP-dependent DNA helicase RecG n=1 Tax=Methyloceanibacter methanicus TaxID=1774968 RepID=A0A1E3W0G5_9HYPH|nr:ATP-dependent DNA helicase RecG [Methyloceanibacter methanicus]ODR99001.1 ATP-dependent DNA helicase RecG [Methyloceanibacter methanicus]
MRPARLNPLFTPVRTLKGVGPRIEGLLDKLLAPKALVPKAGSRNVPGETRVGGHARLIDVLWHLPVGLIDRAHTPSIASSPLGQIVTLTVRVAEHRPGGPRKGRKAPYRILVEDETSALDLVYFKADRRYLERLLPVGETRVISGRLESYDGRLQMTHPDHVAPVEGGPGVPDIEPVYPLTAGLSNTSLRKAVQGALNALPDLPEWIDGAFVAKNDWGSFAESLKDLHAPRSEDDLLPANPARQRLAYDELLANQLALAILRQSLKRRAGRSITAEGRLRKAIVDALPFALTSAQVRSLAEIDADMADPLHMLRLLQGDVGSGKTIVALLAMATAVEAGHQAAFMAPTELLARQHSETIARFAAPAALRIRLLTGRERGKERLAILEALKAGEIDILIGTHALFQEAIAFRDLGLAVIDEQHRFGVHQRLALQAKGTGAGAELLVMTATPIPRTLLLTSYGDLDVSRLDEKPPGRKPVLTRTIPSERLDEVVDGIARAVDGGAQVYWVCPLVGESEVLDLAAAEERFAHLRSRFGDRVGLVHGQLSGKEKDAVMARFADGDLAILVSTTVIEVGVDVPNASVMIIEHAERFGLAQLHQLRGRVGRGTAQSSCLLLYKAPLGETARERLNVMRETEDGFVIAEEDLRLRGGGEVLGTRQSGLPGFRIAQLPEHQELLAAARDEARLCLSHLPHLEGERGERLRLLLYLFERDDAVKLMRAG